ncbi:MAG: hypothetical protein HYU62_06455 [Caulobacterales bacterium]|nr:hypothetical protein [Caulobacterales bacterium]
MLTLIAVAAATALSGAPHQAPDCRVAEIYFESGRANLNNAALQSVDAIYGMARQAGWSGVSATVVGHIDGAEGTQGLVSLDEERAGAIRERLESLRESEDGSPAPWTFIVGGADDAQPAREAPGASQPLNRRARLIVCSGTG